MMTVFGARFRSKAIVNACAAGISILIAVVACETDQSFGSAIVRDSAGVTIIESRLPEWPGADGWRVPESPLLDIGSVEGSAEYQFHSVEGVVRLHDGRIAVADGGSSEIRFFDASGRYLSSSGGEGDAPGEYRMITAVGTGPLGLLWVFDYGNRRFTVLSSSGELKTTVSLGGFLSAVGAVGRLPNGSFVVKEGWGRATGGSARTGLARDPVAVAVISPDGASVDTIGMFPGREVFLSVEDGRAVMSTPLFAHNTSAVVRGDEVFVGIQEKLEIGLYSSDGTLRQIYRVPGAHLDLNASDVAARRQEVLAAVPEGHRSRAADDLDRLDLPNTRPAYGRLLVADDGSLWAGEQVRYPAMPRRWTVFGPDGQLLGDVAMPERFQLYQVGDDWILGVGLDEFDVEHVRLYRLTK